MSKDKVLRIWVHDGNDSFAVYNKSVNMDDTEGLESAVRHACHNVDVIRDIMIDRMETLTLDSVFKNGINEESEFTLPYWDLTVPASVVTLAVFEHYESRPEGNALFDQFINEKVIRDAMYYLTRELSYTAIGFKEKPLAGGGRGSSTVTMRVMDF